MPSLSLPATLRRIDAPATTAHCPYALPHLLRRFAVNTLVVWPMMTLYLYISHHQSAPPATVLMPKWVPFLPVFILPYLAMLLMTWFMPAAIGDRRYFRACLLANLCGYLLVMPWWIITPTTLPRPPLPDGLWAEAVGLLWAIDKPDNIMPCAHGVGPVVVAWFLYRTHPAWRWPLIITLLIGLPSIAFTWQHRPIDILLGILAAAVGITMSEAILKRSTPAVSL